MSEIDSVDYYTDSSILGDPHSYFDHLRTRGAVTRLPHRNVVAVTGYDEAIQVMLDGEHFSTINALNGPFPPLPFEPEGDDISEQLEAARPSMAFAELMFSQHGKRHADLRSLLSALFTPSRLKELEPKLYQAADNLIDEFVNDGCVDLVQQYGGPYATLIIADLLGVSDGTRDKFRTLLAGGAEISSDLTHDEYQANALTGVGKILFQGIALRCVLAHPILKPLRDLAGFGKDPDGRDDILTQLAVARFRDGAKPTLKDVAAVSAILFGAGQDTTAHLLANAFKLIATWPDVQQALRDDPGLIPNFVEEMLRYDGPVKSGARLCQRSTTLGDVEIKAGTTILLSQMGANRDPRRFECPADFEMGRKKAKEHLAFGRGPHTCIGASLARREAIVSIERLLSRMRNIRLSEARHGPEHDRRFDYQPTFVLRSLRGLHLEFDPAAN